MGTNRRIKIELTRTVNLGNFENIKFVAGMEEDIEDDVPVKRAFKKLTSNVEDQLSRMEKDMVVNEDEEDSFGA